MLRHEDHTAAPSKPFEKVRYGNVMLLKPLARGGMAEIYLAEQHLQNGEREQVVVKQPLRKYRTSRFHHRMLLDEAQLGQQLLHPNIVRTIDSGVRGKMPYLVLEYVRGPSLRAVIKKLAETDQTLSREEAFYILTQVLSALSYAHGLRDREGRSMRVVHRDVTPDNILLTFSGGVKLIDFGVAKATNRRDHTQTGMVKGKVPYFAPEQLTNGPVDQRVDQYAAALTACEMLTGARVFADDGDLDIVSQVLDGAAQRINANRATLRALGPLREVLLKALDKDPDARFDTCADMLEALQELTLNAEPTRARHRLGDRLANLFPEAAPTPVPPPPRPFEGWSFAHPVVLGALYTVIAACTIFGAVRLARHVQARIPTPHVQVSMLRPEVVPASSVLSKFTSAVTSVTRIFSHAPTAQLQTPPPRETHIVERPRVTSRDDDAFERRGNQSRVEGSLDVSCLRWCQITVDGVAVHATSPMRDRHLPPGSYLIEAINPPTGQVSMERVTIEPGRHTMVQFRL